MKHLHTNEFEWLVSGRLHLEALDGTVAQNAPRHNVCVTHGIKGCDDESEANENGKKAHRPAPGPRQKHGGGVDRYKNPGAEYQGFTSRGGGRTYALFRFTTRATADLPPMPLGQTLGCCAHWEEAVTVWLGGAGYLSLWESVEGQMEAQVGEHVMSHLCLFLVLFRVSEAVFLEEKIVASDVISQIIIYIFK
jgi:hypothetical protein